MTNWYYAGNEGESLGPVSFDHLKELEAQGAINNDTHVFQEGSADWKTLGDARKANLPPIPNAPAELTQIPPPLKADTLKKNDTGVVLGFSLYGLVLGSVVFVIGLMLTLTVIGAIVGVPMMVLGLSVVCGFPVFAIWAKRKEKQQPPPIQY